MAVKHGYHIIVNVVNLSYACLIQSDIVSIVYHAQYIVPIICL